MQSHERTVGAQFGPQAHAYLNSAVHARGADLDRLTAFARDGRLARALDLGCGAGHVAFALAPFARDVVAVDLSGQMLDAVTAGAADRGLTNIRTLQSGVEDAAVPAGTFDLVVTRFSAHHWRALEPGLRTARRALAPGGTAVFIDVVAPADGLLDTHLQAVELLRDRSHVRDWSVGEWRAACARCGFAIDEVVESRLPLDFADWIARMRTRPDRADAIRALWSEAPAEVKAHFAFDPANGDFTVDTAALWCTAAAAEP